MREFFVVMLAGSVIIFSKPLIKGAIKRAWDEIA